MRVQSGAASLFAAAVAMGACESSDSEAPHGAAATAGSGAVEAGAGRAGAGSSGASGSNAAGASGNGSAAGGSGGQSDSSATGGTSGATNQGGTAGVSDAGGTDGDTEGDGAGGNGDAGDPDADARADTGDPDPDAGADADARADADSDGGQPSFAYISTLLDGVLTCSLDPASGVPTLLPGSTVDPPGVMHGVAVNHSGKFLYAIGEPSRIATYPIAAGGTLPAEPSSSVVLSEVPRTLALDPQSRFAYAGAPFGNTIFMFEIDAATGALTPIGEPLRPGNRPAHRSPAYVAVDPTGHFVYVTQQADPAAPEADNGIRGYRIDQTSGALTEVADSPFGGSKVIAGAIAFRPDGKFLFSSGGGLNAFALDAASGKLTLVEGSPFSLDVFSDPWAPNIAVDPRGDFVYVSRFLLTNHVSGFSIDSASGALQAVPGSPVTTPAPYSIAIEPGGRFLYVGDDTSQVSVFSLSRSNGSLAAIQGSPFAFGGLEAKIAFRALR